jgi:DNA-binding response OmpR family regulator
MTQRILVIDDDADVRETIRIALEAEGYEVVDAGDGQQGLAAFRRRVPDLVITDIVMPVTEGLQTIREIRRLRPAAPILAVSAGGRAGRHDFLEIARSLGAWEVIAKPFDPDELVARVKSCLAR